MVRKSFEVLANHFLKTDTAETVLLIVDPGLTAWTFQGLLHVAIPDMLSRR